MSRTHKPTRGDKVNDGSRIPNANGVISRLIYEAGEGLVEIVVKYDDEDVYYDAQDFDFAWTDKYGGVWVLQHNH